MRPIIMAVVGDGVFAPWHPDKGHAGGYPEVHLGPGEWDAMGRPRYLDVKIKLSVRDVGQPVWTFTDDEIEVMNAELTGRLPRFLTSREAVQEWRIVTRILDWMSSHMGT